MALYDITVGSKNTFISSAIANLEGCDIGNNKIAITYVRGTTLYAIVGSLSGTTWTWGSEVTISSDTGSREFSICKVADDKFCVTYCKDSFTNPEARICSVSTNTITVGSVGYTGSYNGSFAQCLYISDNKIVILTGNDSTNNQSEVCCVTVSGTTMTVGSRIIPIAGWNIKPISGTAKMCLLDTDKFVMNYRTGQDLHTIAFTIASGTGTTLTRGTLNRLSSFGTTSYHSLVQLNTNEFAIFFISSNTGFITGSTSGTTVSLNEATSAGITATLNDAVAFIEDSFVMAYVNSTPFVISGAVDGTTITKGSASDLNSGTASSGQPKVLTIDRDSNKYAAIYRNNSDSYGIIQILDVDSGESGNTSAFFQLF